MQLVYRSSGQPVKIADVITLNGGERVTVLSFNKPHKPDSEGKVLVSFAPDDMGRELFVGVIGAHWIDREDRSSLPE